MFSSKTPQEIEIENFKSRGMPEGATWGGQGRMHTESAERT